MIPVPPAERAERVWSLHRRHDNRLLAELGEISGDFPWLRARVYPRAELEEVRPLFSSELRLLDRIDDDAESWERAYDAVVDAVVLRDPDGRVVASYLLHLDGEEAWWRWSDDA